MTLFKGSLSYTRFFVQREIERPRAEQLEAINLRAFRPLKATDEENERVGWCSAHHAIDLDLTREKVFDDDFVTLGLRVDQFKIPGAIRNAHFREAEVAMLAELGRERLTRTQKEDLRAMVDRKLRERSMPTMRVHDVAWDTSMGVVRLFATSTKTHDAFLEIFEKTFGVEAVREGAYTRAERVGLTASELDALCGLEPLVLHRDTEGYDIHGAICGRRMDLADRIAHCAFLGREFLLYLWWKSARDEGAVMLPGGFGTVTLGLEASIVLERKIDVVERTRLTGPDPSSGRTAKEALRHGELPTRITLRITHQERDFVFVLSDDLTLRTVKLPALLTEEEDERLRERMALANTLETMLDALYVEMLRLRLSPAFRDEVLPAMRRFASEEVGS